MDKAVCHYIYTFTDPNDGIIRYAGQSKNKHYLDWLRAKPDWEFKYGVKPWLWSLKKQEKKPIVNIVLEGLTQEQANVWEIGLIDFIGRKIKGDGTLLNLTNGGAGVHGIKISAESIRKRLETIGFKTLEENVAKAMEMAKANGGKLQNYRWLETNGRKDITNAMQKHPDAFVGIEQEYKGGNSLEDTVAKARKMAEANGGKLQNNGWLRDNGHSDIAQSMHYHPEAFVGIKQIRKIKNLKDTIAKAKKMTEANSGKLQNVGWLIDNSHWDIVNAMRRHPEAFVGIEQIRKRRKK